MSSDTDQPKRSRRTVLLLMVPLIALIIAFSAAKYFAARMVEEPNRAPPQFQIRQQTKQLLAQRKTNVIADDFVGFVLPPNLNQQVDTSDFEFQRLTDEHGFVNPDRWPERADIVFLGDSIIMAEGVGLEGGFVALIDEAIEDVTTVNLGVPGAGLERQLRVLEKYGAQLQPKLVVACFVVSDDLKNDTVFLEWLEQPLDLSYNSFRLSYSRRKAEQSTPKLLRRIKKHILYYWALSVVEPRLWGRMKVKHLTSMPDGSSIMFNRDAVKFAQTEFTGSEPEFENFRNTLDAMQARVKSTDADLMFVLLPSKEELFAEDVTVRQNSAVDVIYAELDQRGISYLNFYPILQKEANLGTPYFGRDAHLNAIGNKIVADTFVDWHQADHGGESR